MQSKQKAKEAFIQTEVGDFVLWGVNRAHYPGQWCLGSALWADARDVLVERSNQNGTEQWREIVPVEQIRFRGTMDDLVRVQGAARVSVRKYFAAISDAEQAVCRARAALWEQLDGELIDGLIKPDFDVIEVRSKSDRGIFERADEEIESARRADAEVVR